MSKTKRAALRDLYIEGWYALDIDVLLESTAASFIFDDPAEAEPVIRSALPGYMLRWEARMQALGGNNQWRLSHRQRRDADGLLTEWEWWEVIGTGVQGAAVILTSDEGVILERITYFDRQLRQQ